MNTTERDLVRDAVCGPDFRRATFAGATRGSAASPWVRVVVRPVEIRGTRHLQFAYFDRKKCVTRNYTADEAGGPLNELLVLGFAGVHLTTVAEEIDLRTTKKGKVLVGRRATSAANDEPATHNRVKDVPLPEGKADRVLEVMGILTSGGRVRPTMRAKFTQVNEFLKHLRHVLDDAGLRALGRPVEILDCGCGSSHLTLAAHHYLNDVLGVPARITGVDVNEEVIRKSTERASRFGAAGLNFACGRIDELDTRPDLVFALHACDTATDDAIAQAVRGQARLLLSVPCCHHALNSQIRPDGPAAVLRPVLRHGILQQRAADLVTDTFRALALRITGYRTDVVEFVSPEHTARNLMIRAVRGLPVGEAGFVAEYVGMKRFWGVTPYIETALGEEFRALVGVTDPQVVGVVEGDGR
jgi:SAM-dependent methyltransferase